MRLHRLRVTAFGPFADTVEVDFDEVAQAGLFLIQGPTGAGKTSLLDAICFALYAGLPGARRGSRQLRSDHAPDAAVPQVRLDFTTGRRRFRVTRSPEFSRPKKRGDGFTRARATVLLEEHVTGEWVMRSTRADEVGEIVTEVLGMGLEQFSKVVLLPQGEFAAFLRADAEERRTLLERLFDISTWTGVEEWLVEQRRSLGAEVEVARSGVVTDLARLRDVVATLPAEVAGDEDVWSGDDPRALQALGPGLATLVARCDEHASATLAALSDAEALVGQAEAARRAADSLAERQRRGAAAAAEIAALDERADAVAAARTTLDAAQRAAVAEPELRAVDRAAAAVARSRRAVSTGVAALPAAVRLAVGSIGSIGSIGSEQGADDASARAAVDDALERVRLLTGPLDRAARSVPDLRLAVERAELSSTAVVDVRRRRAEAEQQLGVADAALGAARETVTTLRSHRAEAAAVRSRHGLLDELVRQAAGLADARRGVVRLADDLRDARDDEQQARDHYLTRRQSRLDGMAAELARALDDDAPCPVCGAVDHPLPAVGDPSAVTPAQVEAAEQHWHDRRTRREDYAARLAAQHAVVETRHAELVRGAREAQRDEGATGRGAGAGADASAVPLLDADAWRDEVVMLAARLRELDTGLVADEVAVARATAAEAALDRQREVASALARAEAVAVAARDADLLDVDRRRAELLEVVAAHRTCACQEPRSVATTERSLADDLSALSVAHRDLEERLVELDGLLREQARATSAHAEDVGRLASAVADQGLADAAACREALRPAPELEALRQRLRRHDDRRAVAEATLAEEEITAARLLPPAAVDEAVTVLVAARHTVSTAVQVQARATQAQQQVTALSSELTARVGDLLPKLDRHEQVADLADLVTGVGADNQLRMRLSSYVLAARLEKVVLLANERLAVMGDGRYELQHTDGLASGRRRSGLGIVVRDLWTGVVRETASLSGGESFMASLALALGLADAVREEAGGFDLQTLFVDEGFGTLDDASLEEVLAVLDGLREGGRSVGVVSHVSDLLTRIPTQISVTKSQSGSQVSVRGVGDPTAA